MADLTELLEQLKTTPLDKIDVATAAMVARTLMRREAEEEAPVPVARFGSAI